MLPTRLTLAALCAAGFLLIGGCTTGGEDEPAPDDSTTAAEQDAEQLDDAAETLSSGSASPEPAPIEDLPVLATRTATQNEEPMEVDLNGVHVDGEVMSVLFSVRNSGQERFAVNQAFDDGLSNALAEGADGSDVDNAFTTDGVYVVDGANAKRYAVARDPSGRCVCSAATNTISISPGQQVTLTGIFTAVPEDVATVSVVIPRVGEFADVPVTR